MSQIYNGHSLRVYTKPRHWSYSDLYLISEKGDAATYILARTAALDGYRIRTAETLDIRQNHWNLAREESGCDGLRSPHGSYRASQSRDSHSGNLGNATPGYNSNSKEVQMWVRRPVPGKSGPDIAQSEDRLVQTSDEFNLLPTTSSSYLRALLQMSALLPPTDNRSPTLADSLRSLVTGLIRVSSWLVTCVPCRPTAKVTMSAIT